MTLQPPDAQTRHRPRILIADDDSTLRAVGRAFLEQDGYEIEEAANGEEACRLFDHHLPDLVLMDEDMPVVDGFEACLKLRDMPDGATTPVVMITCKEGSSAVDRAFDAGATDFEPKPVNWTVLRHRVRYMLRAKQATDQLRASESKNRALLSAIPDLMFQITDEGIFTDLVQGGAAEPALPLDDVLGRRVSDVLPPEVADRWMYFVRRTLATGQMQVFDYELELKSETKSFEARTVVCGTDRTLAIVRDVTDRKRAEEELHFYEYHDDLTRLPNRLFVRERLNECISRAQQQNELVAVIFVGLDRFTQINETFGYPLGDRVLKHVGAQLAAGVRAEGSLVKSRSPDETMMLGRFGADEFTILVPVLTDVAGVDPLLDRLLAAIGEPLEIEGREIYLTASAGLSVYPRDGDDADTLLKNADAAMHDAKRTGRNSRRSYAPEINANVSASLSFETELRRALERGEFRPFFQPQITLPTRRICGAEALIRWMHPTRGVLAPAEFLPVVESIGLSVPVGDQLMRSVFGLYADQLQGAGQVAPVALNISDPEFHEPGLVDRIRRAAADHHFDLSRLELEITERVLISDRAAAQRLLGRLRALGIRVAIDDFSTGYSALGSLRGLPVDTLKIDKSFIRDLESDSGSQTLTASIIQMGHRLGMKVVAEGVETVTQLIALEELGCDLAQGFLFSEAASGRDFGALLARERASGAGVYRTVGSSVEQ